VRDVLRPHILQAPPLTPAGSSSGPIERANTLTLDIDTPAHRYSRRMVGYRRAFMNRSG